MLGSRTKRISTVPEQGDFRACIPKSRTGLPRRSSFARVGNPSVRSERNHVHTKRSVPRDLRCPGSIENGPCKAPHKDAPAKVKSLLGAPHLVVSGVVSTFTTGITMHSLFISLLTTTHGPPSSRAHSSSWPKPQPNLEGPTCMPRKIRSSDPGRRKNDRLRSLVNIFTRFRYGVLQNFWKSSSPSSPQDDHAAVLLLLPVQGRAGRPLGWQTWTQTNEAPAPAAEMRVQRGFEVSSQSEHV